MMTNLFSMFDPSNYYMNPNIIIMITPFTLMINNKFMMKNKLMLLMSILLTMIMKEMKNMLKNNFNKMNILITMSMFMMIASMNIMSLLPFVFTQMSHISITYPMALISWLSLMMYMWMMNFKNSMIHLVPMSTPIYLMNFMVIIEIISNIIRPITLSVRLTANMVAGHLLMSLLSNFMLMNMTNTMMMSLPMFILSTLEMMVAMIQAYVFITLLTLYYNEIF
uniref:ATP synthase subunit a n=1 Tax=Riccardoella reaumuri TaxID=2803873 RepID=A0A7R7UNP6_9ACAR|nr:ATPase subunit 6 [Riccardoella reaumuri]